MSSVSPVSEREDAAVTVSQQSESSTDTAEYDLQGSRDYYCGQHQWVRQENCVFVENGTLRVHVAPFDKMMIDFWRSRWHLHDSDTLKAQNQKTLQKS